MTGAGKVSMWPRPTIDFHFLKPFTNSNPNPTTSNFDPQPISIHHHNPSQIPSPSPPNLNLFQILTQSLTSILPLLKKPKPATPTPLQNLPRGPNFESGCSVPLFRPYVAKVPWHGGARAFLSQLFPRYGHYCGPNWSSGKDGGSMLWDRRPIDWLDFCCYCHDIGYDTHDQAALLKADLAFLECLERPRMATRGGAHLSLLYRSMCITGLRHILIPYRMQLVRMQSGPSFVEVLSNFVGDRGLRHILIPDKMQSGSSFLAMLSSLVSGRDLFDRQHVQLENSYW